MSSFGTGAILLSWFALHALSLTRPFKQSDIENGINIKNEVLKKSGSLVCRIGSSLSTSLSTLLLTVVTFLEQNLDNSSLLIEKGFEFHALETSR